MKLGRSERLLLVAFALSLLLHLIVALVIHGLRSSRENTLEVVTIERRPLSMTNLQTPPPEPRITPVPHPHPSTRPAPVHTAGSPAEAGGTGSTAAPVAAPTVAPVAVASSAAASCRKSDLGAAVVENPPQPDIPNAVRADGTSGVAAVDVRLDAQGTVIGASVSHGTGNPSLDLVAVTMARQARYSPAQHDCRPVPATYTFSVRFFVW